MGRFHVEIAGGGIGGLAAAAAFARRGWSVRVHERQPELRTLGAGIYLWENGLRVLEALGAYDDATRDAHRGVTIEYRSSGGEVFAQWDLLEQPENRVYSVPRRQLLGALAASATAAGAEIVTGSAIAGATPDGALVLEDGSRHQADLVLGVDGVGSIVRESLGLGMVRDRLDEGAIRLIVPCPPGRYQTEIGKKYLENWSGGRRLLVTPINEHEIYLCFTCLRDDVEAQQLPLNKALWSAEFPPLAPLVDMVGPDQGHWDLFTVTKALTWSSGNAAILGDASHGQPPNLGQGGGLAMQNALALATFADRAERREDLPALLEAWELSERPLIEHCQKWSVLLGELAHLPDDLKLAAFKFVHSNAWLREQVARTSQHRPIGASS